MKIDNKEFNIGDTIHDMVDGYAYLVIDKNYAKQLIDQTYKLLRLSDKSKVILSGLYVVSVCKLVPKLKAELLYG